MASWNELKERTREPFLPWLRPRVDAHVLGREGRVRSLNSFPSGRATGGAHNPTPLRVPWLAETAKNNLVLLLAGPPVLALRFGYAAIHRRKGLST